MRMLMKSLMNILSMDAQGIPYCAISIVLVCCKQAVPRLFLLHPNLVQSSIYQVEEQCTDYPCYLAR